MVNCPKCGKELKQIEGKVKLAVQIGDKEESESSRIYSPEWMNIEEIRKSLNFNDSHNNKTMTTAECIKLLDLAYNFGKSQKEELV